MGAGGGGRCRCLGPGPSERAAYASRFCIEGVSMFVSPGAIWGLLATLDHARKLHEIAHDTTPRHARREGCPDQGRRARRAGRIEAAIGRGEEWESKRGQKIARVTVRVVLAWLEELANTEMASQTHRERARPGRGRRGLGNRTVAGGRRAERREALRVTVTRSTYTT